MTDRKKRIRNKSTGRNYRGEYDNYQGRPKQIKNRTARNNARHILNKTGKGGGDVAHKDNNPRNNKPSNLKIQSASNNRSFKRTKRAGMRKV